MPRNSLISLFANFDRFRSDRALVSARGYRHTSWSYNQLAANAVLLANALKSRGIRVNDRVLLWSSNSAEWVAAFWACLLLGAVPVPMDDGASTDFAVRVARDSQVKFVLAARTKP